MVEYTKLIEFTDEGLRTSTKPEILNVLTNMTVEAFGADFVVDEGSAWYIFLDSLSNSLDNVCTAARELYNAQGIINANGSNLDNIVSLAGIYRKKGEADEQLRNRAIKSIYSTATSVAESLESTLLQLDYIEFAKVIDNPQDEDMTVGEVTIAKHNIWVLVKVKKDKSIDPNNTEGAKREKEIAEKILHYKSLGSGTMKSDTKGGPAHNPTVTIDGINYEIKFNETGTKNIYVTAEIKTEITDTEEQDKLKDTLQKAIVDYINSLQIGQDVLMSRVVSAISSKNTYTDFGFDVAAIKIGITPQPYKTMVSVYPYEQAVTESSFINIIISTDTTNTPTYTSTEIPVYIKVNLSIDDNVVKDDVTKNKIIESVTNAITNYVESLNIGQDVLMSRVVSVINSTNTYNDYGYDVKEINIGTQENPTDTMVKINSNDEQAVPYKKNDDGTKTSTITVSIEGYDPKKTPNTTK